MLVTREEKEQLQKAMSHFKEIADLNSRYSDTLVEMLSFFNSLVQELKDKDPQLALRIMNKVTDITKRGIIDEH